MDIIMSAVPTTIAAVSLAGDVHARAQLFEAGTSE